MTRYDASGNVAFASYPQRSVDPAVTNTWGDQAQTPNAAGTSSEYDPLGRVTSVTRTAEPGMQVTTATQYLTGFKTQVTDANHKVTTTSYEAFDEPTTDWPVSIAAPEGLTQTIVRDAFGSPTSITQSGLYNGTGVSVTKAIVYDLHHRVCRTTEPESGSTVTDYDQASNVHFRAAGLSITGSGCGIEQVPAAAQTVYTYDAQNRVKAETPPSGTQSTTYSYDGVGNQTAAISGIATWSGQYNHRNLLTGETLNVTGQPAATLGYAYDPAGNVSKVTYPNGDAVSYVPDVLGRPTRVGNYASGVTYFPNGEVEAFSYGNGTLYAAEENERQLLSNFTYGRGSVLALSEDYAYDANGNIKTIDDLTGGPRSKAFVYDGLNRLTSATASHLWGTETYGYDPLNNIRTRVGNGQTFTYNYDPTNRLASITGAGNSSFLYDNRGNVTSKNGVSLTFDQKNQLMQIAGLGSYAYDAAGRRVMKASGSDSTYYFYNHAGQLLYQWQPTRGTATNFAYLGRKLIARDVHLTVPPDPVASVHASATGGTVAVTWAAALYADSYTLQQSHDGGATWGNVYSGPALSRSVVETALGSYVFRVASCDTYGCSGYTQSNTVTIVAPDAPAISSPVSSTSGSYTVSWNSIAGATSYTLQEQVNGAAWATVQASSALSRSISGKGDGTYGYRVQACDSIGCSNWSATATTTVLHAPTVPTVSAPSGSSTGSYTVSWSSIGSVTSYTLQEQTDGGSWSTIYSGSATSKAISGGTDGSRYGYRVEACNGSGCSAWSAAATVAVTHVTGNIDGVFDTDSDTASVKGWACSTGLTQSIVVELFAGASGSGGTRLSAVTANLSSEPAVASACKTSGAAYRFSLPVTASQRSQYSGQPVYVYGESPVGVGNLALGSSGRFTVPLPKIDTAPTLSVPATSSTGTYTISWTAVAGATSYTLEAEPNGATTWNTSQTGSATTRSVTGEQAGSYIYRVQACNAVGCSGWSATRTIVVSVPIDADGQSYTALTAIPLGTSGSSTIGFEIVGGTSWEVFSQIRSGGMRMSRATGSIPGAATTVKYSWTLAGYPAGMADAGGAISNPAGTPVGVGSNPITTYTTAMWPQTSPDRGRTYKLQVDFYNAAGVIISSSTVTLTAETTGNP